jgi:hypothetical protein
VTAPIKIKIDRSVDERARPMLTAVGGQGWRELQAERRRRQRRTRTALALRVALAVVTWGVLGWFLWHL